MLVQLLRLQGNYLLVELDVTLLLPNPLKLPNLNAVHYICNNKFYFCFKIWNDNLSNAKMLKSNFDTYSIQSVHKSWAETKNNVKVHKKSLFKVSLPFLSPICPRRRFQQSSPRFQQSSRRFQQSSPRFQQSSRRFQQSCRLS